jgi:hypothetical protein
MAANSAVLRVEECVCMEPTIITQGCNDVFYSPSLQLPHRDRRANRDEPNAASRRRRARKIPRLDSPTS